MNEPRKLVIYIASSLDGYIAGENDDISWLSMVDRPGEDYGYTEFIASVDTVILGRKTYDKVLTLVDTFSYADRTCYVITRTERPSEGNVHFYSGDIKTLISKLKSEPGKTIFCDGGAEIVHLLLKEKLVDEITVSYIPTLLGKGVRLFNDGRDRQNLQLLESRSFDSGLVQVKYKLIPEG